MISASVLFVVLAVVLWRYARKYVAYRSVFSKLNGEPSFSCLFGNLHKHPGPSEEGIRYDMSMCEKFKFLHCFWTGPLVPVVVIYHPDSIRPVLKSSAIKPRGGYLSTPYDMGVRWLGEGLLIANGPGWGRNRRLLTPAFHFDILRSYVEVYNNCSHILVDRIREQHTSGEPVDLFQSIGMCALDVILRCCFSYKSGCQTEGKNEYTSALSELVTLWTERSFKPHYFVEAIYGLTKAGRRFYHLCDVVHGVAEDIISKRRKQLQSEELKMKLGSKKTKDFLDTLLTAVDENGVGMSPLEIRNEVDTFLFEGHDTTTSGTAWTLYRLSQHPEFQERVYEEVTGVFGGRDEITWEDLPQLEFTTMCIKEALRMDPAVPFIERKLVEDLEVLGHHIPAGTLVGIHIFLLHNNPHIWDQPKDYNPERFHPDVSCHMDPFQFIPFSAGSRNCIGQNFALNEMKVTVAQVIKNFKLSSDPSQPARRYFAPTLKAEAGAMVYVTPRI